MPFCIGNPLYHWTHLELKRYFDIDETLSQKNARKIWDTCNEMLMDDDFRAQSLIRRSNVEVVCTTDDPSDDLEYHRQISGQNLSFKVLPAFRPDKAVNIDNPSFVPYIKAQGINSYED